MADVCAYLAKSVGYSDGRPVTVRDHIAKVAEVAKSYGSEIGLGDSLWNAGLLHDLGKYSDVFQDLLNGKRNGVDHAMSGAALLLKHGGVVGYVREAVAAHHEGLFPREVLDAHLRMFLNGESSISPMPKGRSVSFGGRNGLIAERDRMLHDGLSFVEFSGDVPDVSDKSRAGKMRRMLMSRMVLSCLVDADHTVSAWEASGDSTLFIEHSLLDSDPNVYLERLTSYRAGVVNASHADVNVNAMRDITYHDCGLAGQGTDRLCSLTAPTGSGKTLAMIRFALERVRSDRSVRRVVFVLPYLSLVDQVADVCRFVFSDVLVDDSVADNPDRMLSKRWDCPCVVTTSVQFFQSLFSAYPGDVRKLHRMANSVIVFDEVQALPLDVFRLAMDALSELSCRYNAHVLLSTATRPGYGHIPDLSLTIRECIADVPSLFSMVRRTGIKLMPDVCSVEEIACLAAGYRNSCVISNLKRQALRVYDAFVSAGAENVFLVSTDLCPEHRHDVISQIRSLQAVRMPVHVSSTQCLEAGVDLDFEKLFRMLAPYTALVQAAGRQNRNGVYPDSDVSVFVPDDSRWYPDSQYGRLAMIVREMYAAGSKFDMLDGVDEYYSRVFRGFSEPIRLAESLNCVNFVEFAKESRLIKGRGQSVIVPYGRDGRYERIVEAVLNDRFSVSMLRDVAGITVQTYDNEGVNACCAECVVRGWRGRSDVHTGTYVLLPNRRELYDQNTGLLLGSGFADMI